MNVTFDELYRNYSSSDMSRSSYVGQRDLFTQIGWEMYLGNPNYENTCALRVSPAFLGAGHKISLRSHNILKGPHSGKGFRSTCASWLTCWLRHTIWALMSHLRLKPRNAVSARGKVWSLSTRFRALAAAVTLIWYSAQSTLPNVHLVVITAPNRSGSGLCEQERFPDRQEHPHWSQLLQTEGQIGPPCQTSLHHRTGCK